MPSSVSTSEPAINTTDGYEAFSDVESYQAVSRAAVVGIILGIFGFVSIWFVPLIAIPVIGLIASILGFQNIRKFPGELTGKPIALAGLALNGLLCIGAPALHTYVYMTEVPDGYERISFTQLKSPIVEFDFPPETALQLDGKQVFLKGYIHPTSIASNAARSFVLVPDLGTCCFGGQPKLTHMVEVTLTGDNFAKYAMRQVKLAGTLKVDHQLKPIPSLQGVFYQLKADVYRD